MADASDAFPFDKTESVDTDGDGIGNNADTDDDNDGVVDSVDAFPLDKAESVDTDGDGTGNNADTDDDGDGVADAKDAYPLISLEGRIDTDGDGRPDTCDSACLLTGMAADPANLALQFYSPAMGSLVGDELTVVVAVQSTYEVSSVEARINEMLTPLIFEQDAYCLRSSCSPGFKGVFILGELTSDRYSLEVTAIDVLGNSVSEQTEFSLDRKPLIVVNHPIQFSVARPELPIDISCSDDVGDCDLTILAKFDNDLSYMSVLASSRNSIAEDLDLSAFDGGSVELKIDSKDSVGQITSRSVLVYVESSINLKEVLSYSGRVIDFDGRNALILDSKIDGDSLSIFDNLTDAAVKAVVPFGLIISPIYSYLTPTGAFYSTKEIGGNVLTSKLYDWNDGVLFDMGMPTSTSPRVAGDYGIWNEGLGGSSILHLRKFSTKSDSIVSSTVGNNSNAVGYNGVVGYWSYPGYSVSSYSAGVNTLLVTDSNYWNTYVETDGASFVYRKHDPCCAGQKYAIAYHDGVSEVLLTDFRENQPSPGRDFQIVNGWVAFTSLGNLGQLHVWTRDPSGVLLQRTAFGSNSYIERLAANGEVMLVNSGRRYLSGASGQMTEISSDLGDSVSINEVWYVKLGRSLFSIN